MDIDQQKQDDDNERYSHLNYFFNYKKISGDLMVPYFFCSLAIWIRVECYLFLNWESQFFFSRDFSVWYFICIRLILNEYKSINTILLWYAKNVCTSFECIWVKIKSHSHRFINLMCRLSVIQQAQPNTDILVFFFYKYILLSHL